MNIDVINILMQNVKHVGIYCFVLLNLSAANLYVRIRNKAIALHVTLLTRLMTQIILFSKQN